MIKVQEHCSFCFKLKSDVKVLVAAPSKKHHICDECVKKAREELNVPIDGGSVA